MARLIELDTGYCTHPGCVALRGAGWRARRFPARAYLIEAGGRHWLWDTGYAPHFLTHTRSGWASLYARVTPVQTRSGQSARAQLRQRGLEAGALSGVLLSHFHGDHIAGLADFENVPLFCAASAWAAVRPLKGWRAARQGFVPRLLPDDFSRRLSFVEAFPEIALPDALRPFESGRELPGSAGQVLIVPLPGHAAGHLGAFVRTAGAWTLLASDAAWSHRSYRDMVPLSWPARLMTHDPAAYRRTLALLRELHDRGRVRIVLTHEGAV